MRFNPRSLYVQGTLDNNLPDDLREGLKSWYEGKGFPVELLKKYYGYGKSLTIVPTPEELKRRALAEYAA